MDVACDVVRVHVAAGIALVRRRDRHDDATQWIPWPPVSLGGADAHGADEPTDDDDDDGVIHLQQVDTSSSSAAPAPSPSLALKREDFPDARVAFEVVVPPATLPPPQNVVVFLHGRGDSTGPFAQLGTQMALPQTAVISLRAPLELPFDMGYTWLDDLDDDFNVIPPTAHDRKRSDSLEAARDFVMSFLETLRDRYHWRLERVFLFGFSQGASVAFHVARTLPVRLGGVVLIAGGTVHGPHVDDVATATVCHDHETPALLICGGRDDTSERQYAAAFRTRATLCTRHVVPHKSHDMIRSRDEMRIVMEFFSTHLYLRNIALENRSDVIEITAGGARRRR